MSRKADAWSSPEAVNRKLAAWWKQLRPERRTKALAEVHQTLPDWLAQDLIRAGLPLDINPGIADPSLAGRFLTPPLVEAFLTQKRTLPPRRWWQFWKRR